MGCKAKNLVILWAIVSVGVCVAGGQSTTQTALSDKGSENSSGSPSNLEPTNHHKQLISGRYQTNQWKPLKNSKYLTYIFRKYGSGGVITFEVRFNDRILISDRMIVIKFVINRVWSI